MAREFQRDVSSEWFDDLHGETWICPHPTEGGADRCPFHRHLPSFDDDRVAELLIERVGDSRAATNRFIGARFDELDLRYAVVEGASNRPADLRDCAVKGSLDLSPGGHSRSSSTVSRYWAVSCWRPRRSAGGSSSARGGLAATSLPRRRPLPDGSTLTGPS